MKQRIESWTIGETSGRWAKKGAEQKTPTNDKKNKRSESDGRGREKQRKVIESETKDKRNKRSPSDKKANKKSKKEDRRAPQTESEYYSDDTDEDGEEEEQKREARINEETIAGDSVVPKRLQAGSREPQSHGDVAVPQGSAAGSVGEVTLMNAKTKKQTRPINKGGKVDNDANEKKKGRRRGRMSNLIPRQIERHAFNIGWNLQT